MNFTPNLNCIIGGGGSGKSTALLSIRAALGGKLPPEENADDPAMPSKTTVVSSTAQAVSERLCATAMALPSIRTAPPSDCGWPTSAKTSRDASLVAITTGPRSCFSSLVAASPETVADLDAMAAEYRVDLSLPPASDFVPGEEGLKRRLSDLDAQRKEIARKSDADVAIASADVRTLLSAWREKQDELETRLDAKKRELEHKD